MDIAIYGATGAVGTRLTIEATQRGHAITALARTSDRTVAGVDVIAVEAENLVTAKRIAAEHDVVVCALGPSREPGGDPAAYPGIVSRLAQATVGARFAVVGGAGSLLTGDGTRLVDTPDFPEAFKPEALAHCAALVELRGAEPAVDWFCLSPAPMFAPGRRSGVYRLGLDNVIGSDLSYEDYAVAFLDELETPAHRRTRFAVAAL